MKYIYEAIIEPDGQYIGVRFPDLECRTFGNDLQHAIYLGNDLLESWLSILIESGKPLPKPNFGHKAPKGGSVAIFSVDSPVPEVETMNTSEAADILDVSQARIRAMIRDGVLDAIKVGRDNMVTTASVKRRLATPRGAGRPKTAQQELTTA